MEKTKLYDKTMVGTITKINMLNMANTATPYKDAIGQSPKKLVGFCIDQTDDTDDGKSVNTSYVVFDDGTVVGGVSATAAKTLHDSEDVLVDMLSDGEDVHISFKMGKSNSNREFVQIIFS